MIAKNEHGKRYGMLAVIGKAPSQDGKAAWSCKCDCGNETQYTGDQLRRGSVKSCGCNKRQNFALINANRQRDAVYSKHPRAANIWKKMLSRCMNPQDKAYEFYGAKGIAVCERWMDFMTFVADMGDPLPGMTIDRKDNEKWYDPSNCRWADKQTQSRNRKTTKLDFEDVEVIRERLNNKENRSALAEEYGVSVSSMSAIANNQNWKSVSFIQNPGSSRLFEFRVRKAA